jgi:undecaprenyl-diphosphatase
MESGRTFRIAAGTTSAIASMWNAPKQRRLALALTAAGLSAIAFANIAEDYLTNDPLARWDVSFARWLAGERSTIGTDFFRVLTFIGSPPVALLPVVLGGAELLNLILKLSFHRARPEVAFVHIDTYSFPSGHAMISTAAYGAFAYLAWGPLRTTSRRLIVVAGTVVLVALISFSRLYLGVHYLSDVLAGIAGGGFWLAVSIALQITYGDRFATRFAGSRADRLAQRVVRRPR